MFKNLLLILFNCKPHPPPSSALTLAVTLILALTVTLALTLTYSSSDHTATALQSRFANMPTVIDVAAVMALYSS